MNTLRLPTGAFFAGIVFSVFLTGCSSLNWPITPVEDIVQLRQQRKDAALEEFDRRRDWAEFQAATTAWSQGETDRCRESLERLLARNPSHVEAGVLLAKLHEQAAHAQADCIEDSGNGASTAHDPQVPIAAAVSALRSNRPDVATRLAKEAVGRHPDSVALHRILGVAYYRSGDYESSQVVLQQALSLDNTSALTYFLQGCTLTKLGKSDEAEAHLRRAEQIDSRYAMGCPSEKTIRR